MHRKVAWCVAVVVLVGIAHPVIGAWEDELRPGDILLSRGKLSPVLLWNLVPGAGAVVWTHVGVYIGSGKVIEALLDGVQETDLSTWTATRTVSARRVRHADGRELTPAEIAVVVAFLRSQVGKPYCLAGVPAVEGCPGDALGVCTDQGALCYHKRVDSDVWYCSELAWAAYQQIGINIEAGPDDSVIFPDEIANCELTYAVPDVTAPSHSVTVLCLDTSGSMAELDRTGIEKLQAARQAAAHLISLVEAENRLGGRHSIGLVSFSDAAVVGGEAGSDPNELRSVLSALQASGNTNLGEGLRAANSLIGGDARDTSILLLTDGMTNRGLSATEILSGPAKEAADRGICLHVIGYGNETDSNIDRGFLDTLAQTVGCAGNSEMTEDTVELGQSFVRNFLYDQGRDILVDQIGHVFQSEVLDLGAYVILQATSAVVHTGRRLHAILTWPGSRLELQLVDPAGTQVNTGYPGAQLSEDEGFFYVTVDNAMPGEWHTRVFGAEVGPSGTAFAALVATESIAPTAGSARDEIHVSVVPELRSWLTLRGDGAAGVSPWVSPIAVTLGLEARAALQQMTSAEQLLVISLLASLQADGRLEEFLTDFQGSIKELFTDLTQDPLGLMGHAGIDPATAPRTVATESIARDSGLLYWYEERMAAPLQSASGELHIVLPLYAQYQVPTASNGYTGFVFILGEVSAAPTVTAADAFLYFATIDEEKVAATAFTLGKANTDTAGTLLLVENRYQWSYGQGMWIEPAD
jgi:uncharacterized protein YycO/uncharacterized protein YegL